jgi:hypothetical protein
VTLLALPDRAEQIFEHGDRIYMTAPVQVFEPAREQIEEYAFSSQVASAQSRPCGATTSRLHGRLEATPTWPVSRPLHKVQTPVVY